MTPESHRVLVADALDLDQLEPLREAGIEVVDRVGIAPEELPEALADCSGLLVRSRTKVTAELLEAVPGLRVVGRAGSGVDNVDLEAATRAGVVVMNVPGGNSVAAAEQTIALMMAVARKLSAAAASLRSGEWDRKGFVGSEVTGKTLGIVGLGKIGQEVARRARGLGMEVLAYDPVASEHMAHEAGASLVPLDELAARSDWLTVHVPLSDRTRHLVSRDLLAKAKPGIRVLNVARGGIVDEKALLEGLKSGQVAGAGLDVFETEPPTDRELIEHPEVVATPHLGASTVEAQQSVARQVAEQVTRYLRTGEVVNGVNLVGMDPALREELAPWFRLVRRLGMVAAGLFDGPFREVSITFRGEISEQPAAPLVAEALCGVLESFVSDRLNAVNAEFIARERDLEVTVGQREHHKTFPSLVRLRLRGDESDVDLAGTLFGRDNLRIVRAFGYNLDVIPEGHLIFCANEDRPGMIGSLGTGLAEAGVNIANMSVGRDRKRGHALAVLNLDEPPPAELMDRFAADERVRWIRHVHLPES